jgi:hypothetical protein
MWDADTGGSQVGSTNTFNAMQLNDGRFACGLNFGNAAFDGSNRWIQVEFRNPAGSGQYQALSPRDKITATPYALYALNGANGVWVYDTNQQSVSVMGKKVGIGTSNPTAALEVVSATGGDDSVKLPAGSIGVNEISAQLGQVGATGFSASGVSSSSSATRRFTISTACVLVIDGNADAQANTGVTVLLDGQVIFQAFSGTIPRQFPVSFVGQIGTGEHVLEFQIGGGVAWGGGVGLRLELVQETLQIQ